MSAQLDEPYPAPPTESVGPVYGYWIILLVVIAVLVAAPGRATQVIEGTAKTHAPSEMTVLSLDQANTKQARLRGIGLDDARKHNAAVPFGRSDLISPPFRFAGTITDRIRARDCLAIAAMAEAGNDEEGQRAVIQVVLNRVRDPAFPKTVCGVVFEGSQRASGCQFTFTCDGALSRRYSEVSWGRARDRATEALAGRVYAAVGIATHYHTDWVHPYWSGSLIKLARVDSHLFFRWPGYWGNAALLPVPYRGGEPAITQLAYLPAHNQVSEMSVAEEFAEQARSDGGLPEVVWQNVDGGAFVLLSAASSVVSAREVGRGICKDRPFCKVLGWFDRSAIPSGYPVPSRSRAKLGFSYFRDGHNKEIILYDCARFTTPVDQACIPHTAGVRSPLGGELERSTASMSSLPSTEHEGTLEGEKPMDAPSPLI